MDFLEKGDIILLEYGMTVEYMDIPIYFYKNQNPYSTKTTQGHINVGIEMRRQSFEGAVRELLETTIQFLFAFHQVPLNKEILARFLKSQVPAVPSETLKIPAGEYLVTEVQRKNNVRKVFCRTYQPKAGAQEFELEFYQNSNFYSNNDRVKVLGKA